MLRLALFGTLTIVAIGIDALRVRLREARTPAEKKLTRAPGRTARRAR
jgi:hypothetical protein